MIAVRRKNGRKKVNDVIPLSTVSNYLVMFMRMVTSAQIRREPDEFEPFLTHPDTGEKMPVREFCETFVEVLGKETGEQQPPCRSKTLISWGTSGLQIMSK
jgi:Peptidase C65 Otubain